MRIRTAAGAALLALATALSVATTASASSAPAAQPLVRATPAEMAAGSIQLCAQVGYQAGFRDNALVTAIAVAMAESGCDPNAKNINGNGSEDRGLWQINNTAHPNISDACAFDALCNAQAAYSISNGGANWTPWSTYNSGAYKKFLDQAQAAAAAVSSPTMGPGNKVNGGIDDVSGDGVADLVWTDGKDVYYLGNNSSVNPGHVPFYGNSAPVVTGLPAGARIAAGSVTGHKTADLMVYDPGQHVVKLYQGAGGTTPYAGTGTIVAEGMSPNVTRIFAADLTGDGFDELIWTESDGTVWYLPNNMGSTSNHLPFGTEQAIQIGSLPANAVVTFGDLNNDHYADLLYTSDGNLYYRDNDIQSEGGGKFPFPEDSTQLSTNGGFAGVTEMTAADVTGDGVADLLWSDGTNVYLLGNNSSTNPDHAFFFGDSTRVAGFGSGDALI
jgi:hypothetical protein